MLGNAQHMLYYYNETLKRKTITLTDNNTDWARTSTAIVLLKNGCWVMSYILALKPSLSEKERVWGRENTQ